MYFKGSQYYPLFYFNLKIKIKKKITGVYTMDTKNIPVFFIHTVFFLYKYLPFLFNKQVTTFLQQSTLQYRPSLPREISLLSGNLCVKLGWAVVTGHFSVQQESYSNSGLRGIYLLADTLNIVHQILMFFNKLPGSPFGITFSV